MYKNDKIIRRYSEPFKLKILHELTTGKLNKYQLGKAYAINASTINEWIKKYNRKDLMNTRVTVKTKGQTCLSAVCRCFNLKRDAYYKHKRRADERLAFEQQVIAIVKQRRQSLPKEGVRKLLKARN